MDAGHIFARHGHEPQRVVLAQVRLGGEGQAAQVVQRPDFFRPDAGCLEGVGVERDMRDPAHQLLQASELQRRKFFARQRFFVLPDPVFNHGLAVMGHGAYSRL